MTLSLDPWLAEANRQTQPIKIAKQPRKWAVDYTANVYTSPRTIAPKPLDINDPESVGELASTIENMLQDGLVMCDGECCEQVNVGDVVRDLSRSIMEEIFGASEGLQLVSGSHFTEVVTGLQATIAELRAKIAASDREARHNDFRNRTYQTKYTTSEGGAIPLDYEGPRHTRKSK